MKKYISLIFIIFFTLFLCGCTKKNEEISDLERIKIKGYITAGVKDDSPPFGYYKDNQLSGIDIDLVRKIAQEIFDDNSPEYIKFVPVTPQNRISMLNSGEVDILVATMSINDKRKLVVNFSIPYFAANQKLMVRKDSKISQLNYFNTNGVLGVVLGTTGEKILHYSAPNARIVGLKNYNEAVELLSSSKIDAVLGDDCILSGLNNEKFKIVNKSYSREFYAVAVRKSQSSTELLEIINGAVALFLDEKKYSGFNTISP